MGNIESLTNNNFKLLSYLYDRKDKDNLVRITQTEISKELELNRGTVNLVFKSLKENGYLVHDETRVGRYYLTEDAVKTVELFRKNNK